MISAFRNNDVDIILDAKIDLLIETYSHIYERSDLDKIIGLAKDIRKLNYIYNKKGDLILTKKEIDLAIEFIRRDF